MQAYRHPTAFNWIRIGERRWKRPDGSIFEFEDGKLELLAVDDAGQPLVFAGSPDAKGSEWFRHINPDGSEELRTTLASGAGLRASAIEVGGRVYAIGAGGRVPFAMDAEGRLKVGPEYWGNNDLLRADERQRVIDMLREDFPSVVVLRRITDAIEKMGDPAASHARHEEGLSSVQHGVDQLEAMIEEKRRIIAKQTQDLRIAKSRILQLSVIVRWCQRKMRTMLGRTEQIMLGPVLPEDDAA